MMVLNFKVHRAILFAAIFLLPCFTWKTTSAQDAESPLALPDRLPIGPYMKDGGGEAGYDYGGGEGGIEGGYGMEPGAGMGGYGSEIGGYGGMGSTESANRMTFRLKCPMSSGLLVEFVATVKMDRTPVIGFKLPDVELIGLYVANDGMGYGDGSMGMGGGMMGGGDMGMGGPGMGGSGMGGMMGPGMGASGGYGMGGSGGGGSGGTGAEGSDDLFDNSTWDQFLSQPYGLQLESRIQGLAWIEWCTIQFKAKHSDEVRDQYRKKLAELLGTEYKFRLAEKELQLKNLEKELSKLREDLNSRQAASDDIIQLEVQRRVLNAKGFGNEFK